MAYNISIWLLPVLIAVTFHEAAHEFVAHLLGDDTAWLLGMVSFDPLKAHRPCRHDIAAGDSVVGALSVSVGYAPGEQVQNRFPDSQPFEGDKAIGSVVP